MTKKEKQELIEKFQYVQDCVNSNYLPRKNTTVSDMNWLANRLMLKPMTAGCGSCMIRDAKRIMAALQAVEVGPVKKAKASD